MPNGETHPHTHNPGACQTNKWGCSPCESHHHDHPSFIITLACSITQQHDPAWNQLAGHASTVKCTLPNLCFGLMENNVERPHLWSDEICFLPAPGGDVGWVKLFLWLLVYMCYSFTMYVAFQIVWMRAQNVMFNVINLAIYKNQTQVLDSWYIFIVKLYGSFLK